MNVKLKRPLCTLTKEEILSLYDVAINKQGKIAFNYSTSLVEEYFDFKEITRDKKLKELGI